MVTFTEEILNGKLHFLCSSQMALFLSMLFPLQQNQKWFEFVISVTFAIKHWTLFIILSAFLIQDNVNDIIIFADKLTKFCWQISRLFQHVMIMSNTLLDWLPIRCKKIWNDPLGSQKTPSTVTWDMKLLTLTRFTGSCFWKFFCFL